jgi:hypothetical protein
MNADNFMSRVSPEPTSGCWLWTAGASSGGYGSVKVDGKLTGAHRASWGLFVGKIPSGVMVCHKCDNPACVNPSHLFLGTASDNAKDMWNKGRAAANGPSRLLDRKTIASIREMAANGEPKAKIAAAFGVNRKTVYNIEHGKTWGYVNG